MTMNVFGYSCKTPGCPVWIKVGEMPEDSLRAISIPFNLGDDPRQILCPDCKQAHSYYFSEKKICQLLP